MKKKLLSLALCLVMLLGVLPTLPAVAAETTETAETNYENDIAMSKLADGTATFATGAVYSISSVDELYDFAELCTADNDYFAGATVILGDNITMNSGWTAGAEAPTGDDVKTWEPISLFKGVFDGQGNTVSGFYAPVGDAASEACGLFATVGIEVAVNTSGGIDEATHRAAVKNLNITNSYFGGGKYVGAVCGLVPADYTNFNTKFENIDVSSTIIEAEGDSAGGIVGRITSKAGANGRTHAVNEQYPICVDRCKFSGNVVGNATNVGGIIGKVLIKVDITNCVNSGTVESTLPYKGTAQAAATVGGIIGAYTNSGSSAKVTLKIKECTNNGDVFSETITKFAEIGGIIGYTNVKTVVENCVNSGDVYTSAAKSNSQIGGILGLNRNSSTTISDCVNIGNISMGLDSDTDSLGESNNLGGIAGHTENTLTINRCANFGNLSVTAGGAGVAVGGVLGGSYIGKTLTDCVSSCVISADDCVVGGIVGNLADADGNAVTGTLTRCVCITTVKVGETDFNTALNGNGNVTATDCAYDETSSSETYINSVTDLNAMMNLTAYDWTDTTNGWKIAQIVKDGEYLPMPATVAALVAVEKTESQSVGVDYHGVQVKNDKSAVRFVATVDDLNRDKIGFEVYVLNNGQYARHRLEDGTVYTALTYNKSFEDGEEVTELYEVEGKYLGALVFENVPATGVVIFEVKAFSQTGTTRSYDDAYIVIIKDGAVAASYQK